MCVFFLFQHFGDHVPDVYFTPSQELYIQHSGGKRKGDLSPTNHQQRDALMEPAYHWLYNICCAADASAARLDYCIMLLIYATQSDRRGLGNSHAITHTHMYINCLWVSRLSSIYARAHCLYKTHASARARHHDGCDFLLELRRKSTFFWFILRNASDGAMGANDDMPFSATLNTRQRSRPINRTVLSLGNYNICKSNYAYFWYR